jgi:hypothetical protein
MMKQVKYPNLECYITIEEIKRETWRLHDLGFQHGKEYIWLAIRHYIFNWSGHINEEDVSYSVVTEKGRFFESIYQHKSSNYIYDGRVYKPHISHPILYYGEPITENYYIVIDPDELIPSTTLEIIFSIGGRKSPQKRSTFLIDIALTSSANLRGGFSTIENNKLVIDSHLDEGMNKDMILGRLIN